MSLQGEHLLDDQEPVGQMGHARGVVKGVEGQGDVGGVVKGREM